MSRPSRVSPSLLKMSVIRYPNVIVEKGCLIGNFVELGKPYRLVHGKVLPVVHKKTFIGAGTEIGSYVVIGKGTQIGSSCLIDDFAKIEQDVSVGNNSRIIYGSIIGNWASIGDNCIIAGRIVGENSKIGARSRIFGSIVHGQTDPSSDWDEGEEPSAIIGEHVFVGFNALIIGGVNLGKSSYVCAGAILTIDLPNHTIAHGINKLVHFSKWPGRLKESSFFDD